MSLDNNSTLLNNILTKVNNLPSTSNNEKLNFTVVGGTTEPSNPVENTIWVNTSTKISGWVISPVKPSTTTPNTVWIYTSASSDAAFNAIINNGIQLYPLYAKQYINGAWVDKTAKSWQGGKWVDWIAYLYKPGNQYEDITGGWVSEAIKENSSAVTARAPTIRTDDNGYLRIGYDGSGARGGIARMKNKFLLTEEKQLSFSYDAYSSISASEWLSICVWSEMGTYYKDNLVCEQLVIIGQDKNINVDISGLTDSYYIGIRVYTDSGITIKEITMK